MISYTCFHLIGFFVIVGEELRSAGENYKGKVSADVVYFLVENISVVRVLSHRILV